MNETIRRPVAVFACILALGLAGCGKKGPARASARPAAEFPLPDPPQVAGCEPGVAGGRLVATTFADPKTLNPINSNESSSEDIIRFLFSSLVILDWPTQKAKPALAESWTVEPDQKTWTYKLRRGLRWSDGHPLTADDVVFTWNEIVYNPKIVNVVVDLMRIDGKNFTVSKLDDHTIRIVTPEIYAPFEEYVEAVAILPKHILSAAVAAGRFESAYGINTPPAQIVGSGPFRLKQHKPGQFTLVERNPYFWEVDKKGQRLPYLDGVMYTVVPDMNAMSLRFLRGESDVHEHVRPDEFERFDQESAKGRFQRFELGVGPERAFLWFNQNTNVNPQTGRAYVEPKKLKWFRNAKFRQAISHAIDRRSIIKSILAGRGIENYGYVSLANKKWYNPDTPKYVYDPARARTTLKEIGIEDRDGDGMMEDAEGNRIEFVLLTNTGNNMREKTAVLIEQDLKQIGIKATPQRLEFNAIGDKIDSSRDYDCILMGLAGGGADPAANMNVLKSDGFTHWWFPKQQSPSTEWEARIDFLMNAQLKTIDFQERKKYFDEIQVIMARESPFIYTVSPYNYSAIRADIGNVRPTVLAYYRLTWNAEELYFKKK